MKKILLSIAAFGTFLGSVPSVLAADYRYDCTCQTYDSRGNCRDYTCDAFRTRAQRSYYNDSYYDNSPNYNGYNPSYNYRARPSTAAYRCRTYTTCYPTYYRSPSTYNRRDSWSTNYRDSYYDSSNAYYGDPYESPYYY